MPKMNPFLAIGFLISFPAVTQANVVSATSPDTYQPAKTVGAIEGPTRRYSTGKLTFSDYDAFIQSQVHAARNLSATPAPIPASNTISIADPQQLLTSTQKINLQKFLALIPTSQWNGVTSISIQQDGGSGLSYDATSTTLILRVGDTDAPLEVMQSLAAAVGYYDYQFLLDARTKSDFDTMARRLGIKDPTAIAHYFADSYGINLFIGNQLATIVNFSKSFGDPTYITDRLLFFSSFLMVSQQPKAYTFLLADDGSVQQSQFALYRIPSGIVVGAYEFGIDAAHELTTVSSRGQKSVAYTRSAIVSDTVFRNVPLLKPRTSPRR